MLISESTLSLSESSPRATGTAFGTATEALAGLDTLTGFFGKQTTGLASLSSSESESGIVSCFAPEALGTSTIGTAVFGTSFGKGGALLVPRSAGTMTSAVGPFIGTSSTSFGRGGGGRFPELVGIALAVYGTALLSLEFLSKGLIPCLIFEF